MSIRFVALETELVKSLQTGGLDANGQTPEHHVCAGGMMPCRHCLEDIKEGEPYLVLAHRPFPAAQPYAEQGPIFVHANPCVRHAESANVPRTFLTRQGLPDPRLQRPRSHRLRDWTDRRSHPPG